MEYPADLSFLFMNPTRVVYGAAPRQRWLRAGGAWCRRALVVRTRSSPQRRTSSEQNEGARTRLRRCVLDVPADSGVHTVNAGAAAGPAAGRRLDCQRGRGSVIDTAKGIAILLTEGGSLLDYQGFQLLSRRQTPHISIPTTAGNGSEVTYFALVKDHENRRKIIFGDHHIIPDVAILDPNLTVGLPPLLTAATGWMPSPTAWRLSPPRSVSRCLMRWACTQSGSFGGSCRSP